MKMKHLILFTLASSALPIEDITRYNTYEIIDFVNGKMVISSAN